MWQDLYVLTLSKRKLGSEISITGSENFVIEKKLILQAGRVRGRSTRPYYNSIRVSTLTMSVSSSIGV